MTLTRKMTGVGTAVALSAILFAAFAMAADAQQPPYRAFGIGQEAGAEISVTLDGEVVASTEADAEGQWVVDVPGPGDTIGFLVNGEAAEETAEWTSGGSSAVPDGQDLTVAPPVDDEDPPVDDEDPPAVDDEDPPAVDDEDPPAVDDTAPPPSDTGNAGLLGGGAGASMALVMLLGVAAATLVAGARTATRRN